MHRYIHLTYVHIVHYKHTYIHRHIHTNTQHTDTDIIHTTQDTCIHIHNVHIHMIHIYTYNTYTQCVYHMYGGNS